MLTFPICDRDLFQVCISFTHHAFIHCSPATVAPAGCSGPSSCTSGVRSLRGAARVPVSECGVILCSARAHSEVRAEPTQCDICEGREIIYMAPLQIGARISI